MRAFFLFSGLALLAAAAGCSSSGASVDGPQASGDVTSSGTTATSGSRLRAKYTTSGDARQLVGFFDTERQEDCTFRQAEAGHVRCLPADLIVSSGFNGTYSDPGCEVGTVGAPVTGCASPAYVLITQYDTTTCATGPFEIHKVLPASALLYALAADGSCGVTAPSTTSVLKLGSKIAWSSFAEGTVTSVAGALTEQRVVTPDGASATYGYHLDALDADCRFRAMSDGAARCIPDAPSGPLLYGDTACTQPTAVDYYQNQPLPFGCTGASSGPTLYIADGSKAGDSYSTHVSCSGITAVYKVLDTKNDVTVYRSATPSTENDNQSCITSDGFVDSSARQLGDEISGSLPSAPRISSGSGRLVTALVLTTADDGTSVLVPGFHDTQLDLDCTFETASDGKLRCLPTAPSAQLLFTDDACTSTGQVAVVGPDCTRSGATRYGRTTSATCPPTTTVVALSDSPRDYPSGSISTGPDRCATVAGIDSGYDATVADPAQFAEGQLFTE